MRAKATIAGALVAAAAVAAAVAIAGRESTPREPAAKRLPALRSGAALARAIEPDGLLAHLGAFARIAGRNGGDRAAGGRGYRDSVAYVEERLRAAGWRVRRRRTSFLQFEERTRPRVRTGGRPVAAATLRYSGSGSVEGRAVAVGSGCAAAEYAALDRGDVAVARRGGCLLREIALAAQGAGAAAVLLYDPTRPGPPLAGTLVRPGVEIPALALRRAAGRALAAGGRRVSVRVDASSGRRSDVSVIAELGRGAPTVMAGAHLDSVPAGPGINDNATGVAALLEFAEHAARVRPRPRRRVVLAFWAAEELGLYGSREYVRALGRSERRRPAAYLNLDIVGSGNGGRFVYGGTRGAARAGGRAARRWLRRRGVRLDRIGLIGGGSDHAPFHRAGIPVLGLFSGASEVKSSAQQRAWGGRARRTFDSCYHLRCDRLARVDRRALSELSGAAAIALYAMAWR